MKLICSGKILEDTKTLFEQGVKNGQQILAIALSESPNEIVQHENKIKELEDFKSDSRLLAVDNEYMQVIFLITVLLGGTVCFLAGGPIR